MSDTAKKLHRRKVFTQKFITAHFIEKAGSYGYSSPGVQSLTASKDVGCKVTTGLPSVLSVSVDNCGVTGVA